MLVKRNIPHGIFRSPKGKPSLPAAFNNECAFSKRKRFENDDAIIKRMHTRWKRYNNKKKKKKKRGVALSRFARQIEKKARERSSSLRVTNYLYSTYVLLYIKSKTEERLSLSFLRHKKFFSLLIYYLQDDIFFVFFVCCCCFSIHERQNFVVVVVEDEVVFAPRGVVFFFVFFFDEKKCDDVSKISPSRPSSSPRTTTTTTQGFGFKTNDARTLFSPDDGNFKWWQREQ